MPRPFLTWKRPTSSLEPRPSREIGA
jgi:hypothetical protein